MFRIYINVSVLSASPCTNNIQIIHLNLESEKWCRGMTARL